MASSLERSDKTEPTENKKYRPPVTKRRMPHYNVPCHAKRHATTSAHLGLLNLPPPSDPPIARRSRLSLFDASDKPGMRSGDGGENQTKAIKRGESEIQMVMPKMGLARLR